MIYCFDDEYVKVLIQKGMKVLNNKKVDFCGKKCIIIDFDKQKFSDFELDKRKCFE